MRLVLEQHCEHGSYGKCGHRSLGDEGCAIWNCLDPSHACPGGSRTILEGGVPDIVRTYYELEPIRGPEHR